VIAVGARPSGSHYAVVQFADGGEGQDKHRAVEVAAVQVDVLARKSSENTSVSRRRIS
jgi:hypothetical protein